MAAEQALREQLRGFREHIEQVLETILPPPDGATSRLAQAMRYSVLGGGKRLRPLLVYVTGTSLGCDTARLDAPAAAVELIHVYSLIHDDLPAMDDDDLRRGRPTCHRAFDEGIAILAGDALQALAFEVLARPPEPGAVVLGVDARLQMLATLSKAIGTFGMAGGQAIDLLALGRRLEAAEIELMHRRKTGALIQACVELGALAAGVLAGADREALARYGAELGLAFQIQDDILDVTGETAVMGKQRGADAALGKPTYPSLFGLETARALAHEHCARALSALAPLGPSAEPLRQLAHFVVERAN